MPKLSNKDISHVAKLANLELDSKEIEKFKTQLTSVLSYIDELGKVDTKNIEPTNQTTGLTNVKRKDEVKESDSLTQKEALSGTEDVYNNYFKVSAVLEKDK